MKDLTVIVPLNEYNDEVKGLLHKALLSFEKAKRDDEEVLVVSSKDINEKVKKDFPNLKKFVESTSTDFQTQINEATNSCRKYFSILEFDDEYTPNWFKNVEEYFSDTDDISIYLPLTEVCLFDKPEKGSIGYVNEAVWALSFSDELGYLDLESLLGYMNFNTTGGVFKTSDFVEIGKLKRLIKLTFWYEFLLRAVHNGKKVYVVPKVGYIHTLNRKGSLSSMYNETISNDESDFWIELAKKDYLFKKERDITHYQYN